jgi:hypothetical protein
MYCLVSAGQVGLRLVMFSLSDLLTRKEAQKTAAELSAEAAA